MQRGISTLVLLTAAVAFAQEPTFYTAIRNNDLAALHALVKDRGANVADAKGETPLMFAAALGSLDSFKFLLDSGADAKAHSKAGVTPLHWAVSDLKKVRMLLDKGADVNAKSEIGRTPLLIAASNHGASAIVKLLLTKGAQVDVADAVGMTPLFAAASCDDLESVRALLARGANPNLAAANGFTALHNAAGNGNVEITRLLLAHKANPNAVSGPANGQVKNGPIALGYLTPLHWAAVNGGPAVTKLLLDAGARIDLQDVRGMTALMSAVATDHADPEVVRLLLAKGSDPAIKSKANESTFDWARKFNNPAILPLLKLQSQTPQASMTPVANSAPVTPRQAVERAMPLLQRTSDNLFKDGGCVACHAQPVTSMAAALARARGWRVNEDAVKIDTTRITASVNSQVLLQARETGGWPDTLVYYLLGSDAQAVAPSAATDAVVHYLAAKQRAGGNWLGVGGSRAPIQDLDFSRTAMSIRALSVYGIPGRKAEFDERINRAAKWLGSHNPATTENRVMQLLGLQWAAAEPRVRANRLRELTALQKADGGWSQTPYLGSDAYATGQVLYTLHQLGVASTDPAFRKGVDFLLRTQKDDGSWYVKNRAMKLQPYFESGFPYEHDQWISASATAWATMALSLSEPERTSVAMAAGR